MRTVIALATMLATTTGCFTTWALTQVTGTERAWDEKVQEASVPLPGVEERLSVTIPLAIEYETSPSSTTTTTPTTTTPPRPGATPLPFELACRSEQRARDVVYRSAFRYGSRWKKTTALMFLAEAAIGTTLLLAGNREDPREVLAGGFFAVDAVGTAALFFIPRKEIYRQDEKPVITPLRTDCPEGLVLEIGGDSFPVNAAGRIGELGEAALDQWMAAPTGSLQVSLDGRSMLLGIGANEQCAWNRAHHPEQTQACGAYGVLPRATSASIAVPAGTLTAVAAP